MTSAAMTSTETRTHRSRSAVHATIFLIPCEGPEQRWLAAVAYAGTDRLILDLCWSQPDYDTAAALGNALWAWMNTLTVAQMLDACPNIPAILNLAA